jgi:hypothetical protein
MKKKESNLIFVLLQFCLMLTILMIVWTFVGNNIKDSNSLIENVILVLITGCGAIAIYILLGARLREIEIKYFQNEKK